MIIDSHLHLAKAPDSKTQDKNWDDVLALLLKEIKASGVSYGIVIASSGEQETHFAFTEPTLKTVAKAKNLSVVGSIDPTNYKQEELEQLDYWLKSGKIVGLKLLPGYQYFYPGDENCRPIYRFCLKYDVPVIFHSGDTYSPGNFPKVKYSHPLHIDDAAAEFPDLKIIIAHMGNPWLPDCAELLYKNQNVYADISGLIVPGMKLNSAYGRLMKQRIQELVIYSGSAQKLLYGTDWPLAGMKDYIKFTKQLGFSNRELEHIFYKNALQLFKIKI